MEYHCRPANNQETPRAPSRHFVAAQQLGSFRSEANVAWSSRCRTPTLRSCSVSTGCIWSSPSPVRYFFLRRADFF